MSDIEIYILYSFLGFISLLLVTLVVAVLRLSFVIGDMQGQIRGLSDRIGDLNGRIDDLNGRIDDLNRRIDDLNRRIDALEIRVQRLEERVAALGEEIAEIRGMLLGLNSRIDLLMTHRHDGEGRVVIVPEEVSADD